MIAVLTPEG